MSTTREMNVQRSIGKRILAVVAGVGLMVSGAAIAAPGAQADGELASEWPMPGYSDPGEPGWT